MTAKYLWIVDESRDFVIFPYNKNIHDDTSQFKDQLCGEAI